jgi:hypothetical protein
MPERSRVPEQYTSDIDELNALLRGEVSAVETYQLAIGKFEDTDTVSILSRLHDDHLQAVGSLEARIRSYGGLPSESSGPWGAFVAAITGAAKLIGPQTLLVALREGEKHGLDSYEAALRNEGLSVECRYVIRGELIPRCREHAGTLDWLIKDYDEE